MSAATEIALPKFGRIPPMTDPLGRHWGQPEGLRDRVRLFDGHACIDESDWCRLPRYESSYPSGTYTGKVWRRGPWLCWYGREKGDRIVVGASRALVQTNGTNAQHAGCPA